MPCLSKMVLMPMLQVQYSADGTAVSTRYDPGGDMVRELQATSTGMDERLQQSQIRLFQNGTPLQAGEVTFLLSGYVKRGTHTGRARDDQPASTASR